MLSRGGQLATLLQSLCVGDFIVAVNGISVATELGVVERINAAHAEARSCILIYLYTSYNDLGFGSHFQITCFKLLATKSLCVHSSISHWIVKIMNYSFHPKGEPHDGLHHHSASAAWSCTRGPQATASWAEGRPLLKACKAYVVMKMLLHRDSCTSPGRSH